MMIDEEGKEPKEGESLALQPQPNPFGLRPYYWHSRSLLSLPPALISLLQTHIDVTAAENSVRSLSSTVNTECRPCAARGASTLVLRLDHPSDIMGSTANGTFEGIFPSDV